MKKLLLFLLVPLGLLSYQPVQRHAADPVKVAAIFSLSGDAREDNSSTIVGLKYAIDYYNKHGGINGRQIELVLLDNKSTPAGSKVAAEAAVKAHVVAIIGSGWSSHSMEAADRKSVV